MEPRQITSLDQLHRGAYGVLEPEEDTPKMTLDQVDLSIIRDIDTDVDKQQLVLNLVDYAHKRDMKIVGEGLENAAELKKVLELGVDLLQGFYLARPMAEPASVNPAALSVIAAFHTIA